jgi:hypothetical protein
LFDAISFDGECRRDSHCHARSLVGLKAKITMQRMKMHLALGVACLIAAAGCDITSSSSTNSPQANTDLVVPVTQPNPGGAPAFGSASGMGFSTGDAAQSGGQGTGLMSFNNTGEYGLSVPIKQTEH